MLERLKEATLLPADTIPSLLESGGLQSKRRNGTQDNEEDEGSSKKQMLPQRKARSSK